MKWIEISGLQLDCEQILYSTDVPEIFICIDQSGNRYLSIYEDDTEYLIVPVPLSDIRLLNVYTNSHSVTTCGIITGSIT